MFVVCVTNIPRTLNYKSVRLSHAWTSCNWTFCLVGGQQKQGLFCTVYSAGRVVSTCAALDDWCRHYFRNDKWCQHISRHITPASVHSLAILPPSIAKWTKFAWHFEKLFVAGLVEISKCMQKVLLFNSTILLLAYPLARDWNEINLNSSLRGFWNDYRPLRTKCPIPRTHEKFID